MYTYTIRDNLTNKLIIQGATDKVAASVLNMTVDELVTETSRRKIYLIGIFKVSRRLVSEKYPIELQEEWDKVCGMFREKVRFVK